MRSHDHLRPLVLTLHPPTPLCAGWLNIVWKKIDLLEKFGIEPWYTGSRDGGYDEPTSLPPAPPQPSPMPVPPPSPSPTPSPPTVPPFTIDPPPASTSPTRVPLPPLSPTPVPQPPAPTTSSCAVRVEYTATWPLANGYYGAVLNVFVSNTGDEVIETPWHLELKGDVYNKVMSSWNWDPVVVDGIISGAGSASWLALQPNANEYNVGLIIRDTSDTPSDYIPTGAALNGLVCSLSGTSRIAR